jgi:predicted transcriptional regulator
VTGKKAKPPTEYISNNIIAEALDVTNAAVSNWLARKIPGLPAPDAVVRYKKKTEHLWLASRLAEWRAWHASWKDATAEYQLVKAEQELQRAQKRVAALKKQPPENS